MLDIQHVFYKLGMVLLDPHHTQQYPSSSVNGLRIATSSGCHPQIGVCCYLKNYRTWIYFHPFHMIATTVSTAVAMAVATAVVTTAISIAVLCVDE